MGCLTDPSEMTIRVDEILFVCTNLIIYGVFAKKCFLRSWLKVELDPYLIPSCQEKALRDKDQIA